MLGVLKTEVATVTAWIDQLAGGKQQAAEQLWQHISARVREFAQPKLDAETRRRYDEDDAANSAFHSLCRGLADGRMEAENRDALWGLLAVITSRKISTQRRYLNRLKRGAGDIRGESGFAEFGGSGINAIAGDQRTPDALAEISESCAGATELPQAIGVSRGGAEGRKPRIAPRPRMARKPRKREEVVVSKDEGGMSSEEADARNAPLLRSDRFDGDGD